MHVAIRDLVALSLGAACFAGAGTSVAEPRASSTAAPTDRPTLVMAGPEPEAPRAARPEPPLLATEPVAEPASDEDGFGVPCLVVGRPGCGTQPLVEIGMGWGESRSYVGTQWSYRGYLDAGLLVGVDDDLQIGPTAELGFDVGRVNSGYSLATKLRARYWIGGWYIALDGAVGGAFEQFTFDEGTENGTREGLVAELGLSVLGVLGPYAAIYALDDFGGRGSHEERWIVGFRGSIASWAAAIGLAFSEGTWLPF